MLQNNLSARIKAHLCAMRAGRPAGGFLWYLRADAWERRIDCVEGRNSSSLLSEAFELPRLYSSATHENLFYPVEICQASFQHGGEYGTSPPAEPSGHEDLENTTPSSAGKRGNHSNNWHCVAVCAFEDVVAVADGSHVYVSSLMRLGQKLRERLEGTRLSEYVRLGVEDEKSEHVLSLTEVPAVPRQIPFPEAVVSVACGAEHLLLCTSLGRVYSMGSNRHGQLGRCSRNSDFGGLSVVCFAGHYSSSVSEFCSPAAVAVYAGSNFSFAIARRHCTPTEKTSFSSSGRIARPAECTALSAESTASTSCSTTIPSSAAQKRKGVETRSEFHSPLIEHTVSGIASTADPSLAENSRLISEPCGLLYGGKGEILYSWGCNDYGQLGIGSKETAFKPLEVTRPRDVSSWDGVAAGFAHTVMLTGSQTVYSCGLNLHGQLGLGTTKEETSLHKIDLPEPVQQVSCGTWHTLFLTSSGQLLTAGRPPEFPYADWLQSGSLTTNLTNTHRSRCGTGLEYSADKKLSSAASYATFQGNASCPDGGSQAQTLTSNFHGKAEQHTRPNAMVTTSQSVLLSTTRHLSRFRADANALVQSKSSVFPRFSEIHSAADTPFARAPGILRIKGFREDLKFISAGSTTSAAIGLDEHTKRCRLYLWKATEPREYPENWLFVSEVYDASVLLKIVGEAKAANIACHCAASGVYLWTAMS